VVAFEATHRSQAPLQLPVVGFHSVVTKGNVSNWTSVTVCAWMSPCVMTMGGN
jgi:hypothetical protein